MVFFRPVMVPRRVSPGESVEVAGMSVRLFDQDHGFVRTLGLRVGAFGYSTDVVDLNDEAFDALTGVDTWVVGCFQRAPHRTHAWLDRVLGWVERVRPRRTVLTHMGTDMDWRWLTANLPHGVEPGQDGQILTVPGPNPRVATATPKYYGNNRCAIGASVVSIISLLRHPGMRVCETLDLPAPGSRMPTLLHHRHAAFQL